MNGEYGRFNELIRKEKQAKDYFLLVGPPGTGKTSCALRYMVEEALSEPDTSILLLSYTNRAVDEICSMLLDSGIAEKTPFIRIGSELSCDKRFVPYLLKHSLADCPKLTDIRQKIDRTRIFVSTTTSLNSRLNLFTLKHFQLALIDEASQILEPDLISILSARHQQHNAIDKFVLVGDYKQLPAIAQQSAEEAAVTDPLLRQIGLEDCRNSLFERLYKSSPDTCRSVLRQQGRMHPAIAEFPNQTFYYQEQLECVPLPHQLEETPYSAGLTAQDPIDRLLLERRMVFIPAEAPESLSGSDKTNPHEARIVATLLAHIYRLTESHFDPNRTVGVIVPYRNQIAMIRKEIARLQLPDLLNISIDTVERYQGSQRDVIIYSFTVQNFSQLNFLTANTFQEGAFLIDRKLNVALTRARKQLLLTGNPHILGANITFYKLLEYIRLHNGYLETDAESFCQGNFTLPSYRRNWELEEGSYSLPAHFQQAFEQLVPPPQNWEANEAHYREVTAYGRCDFRALPEEMTPQTFCQAYNYFYLRKQYAAAQALFTGSGNWLYDLIRKVSGRVVFCDLSYEAGASGLAFADVCRSLPHLDLTYVDIYPLQEMGKTAETFFQASAYKHIQTSSYPRLSAVKPAFWQAHSVLTELVIFNLSSLFDRIAPREARNLALQINQLVHARPLNHYVLVYRDDAGPCRNNHSYTAFCNHLSPELKPLQPQMPLYGKSIVTLPKDFRFHRSSFMKYVPTDEKETYPAGPHRRGHFRHRKRNGLATAPKGMDTRTGRRREEKLKELQQLAPDRIHIRAIDICQADAPDRLQELIEEMGGMDLYLHCSGIGHQNYTLAPDIELQTLETNGTGFVRMVTAAFRYFARQQGGHLAVISSIAGTKGLGAAPAYSATKRFQNIYIDSLEQLACMQHLPIRFTDIRPGFVATGLLNDGKHYPMLMSTEKVARHIVRALEKKKRIALIDWRYRIMVALWHLIPPTVWKRLPIRN